MAQSIRWVIRGRQGRVPCSFKWPIITARSVVHVTAAEVAFGTTSRPAVSPGQDFFYKDGAANVWVSNISPHRNEFINAPGSVFFYVHIDWDSPLDVAITITVEDNIPVEIQGYLP